ncbi:putative phosphoesterase [Chitinophaga skermanii]|uniref:Putative phosphoesterase n=1 Tax=Chitinophaga skermanii TaxID=331697 RepID=A0A327R308_9BACT|nr:ligase-associated DNA damage response endonuclease PdeM [Chitinophaga skermanii]RAJ11021.1 putative phosphoesterase [Chitinophaga skermanii]
MGETYFSYKDQKWCLSAQRAIYWEDEKALLIADLHCGKSAHFRREGIAVPANLVQEDLFRLQRLITQFSPSQLIIVGDMFHSTYNNDVEYFNTWRHQFPHIQVHLVNGNHDIMPTDVYVRLGIQQHDHLNIRNIHFSHDPALHAAGEAQYVMSGHVHPGVTMYGAGKQALRLPCFYFGEEYALLPAFSAFTGLYSIKPAKDEPLFVLADGEVIRMQ